MGLRDTLNLSEEPSLVSPNISVHIVQGFDPQSNSVVPDPGEQALLESGLPLPEAQKATHLPPGGGEAVLPHYQTFSMLVNSMSRTYRWSFDEALRHSQQNALAIRRDPVVMHALRQRQIPVTQLPWHLETEDDTDEQANEGIKLLTAAIKAIPRLQQYLLHLQEALWFGRYGVQQMMEWDYSEHKKQLRVRDHRPINGDKLVFRWGGEIGILVHAAYAGSWQVTDRGRAHFLTPEEREQVVVHRFEPEDADFFEGELAGGIAGVGIRSRIYWLWYLRQQVFAFLMDYLERVGAGGFTIYYYEMGNPQSLTEVQQAAEAQWRNNAILFPRYRDQKTSGPGVDNVAVSTAGAALLQALVTEYFDNIIRQYILGQSLTTQEASGGGLGDGVAGLHEDSFARLIKYDAVNLQETLNTDLVAVLQKYNAPRVTKKIKWVFEVDKPNAAEVLEASQAFFEMGGTLDEDELRGIIGLAKPAPGASMLAKYQSMSPAGMAPGMAPEGMPMLGQPGPEAGAAPMPGMDQAPQGPPGMQPPVQMRKRGLKKRYAKSVFEHLPDLATKYGGEFDEHTREGSPSFGRVKIPYGNRHFVVHSDMRHPDLASFNFDWEDEPDELSQKSAPFGQVASKVQGDTMGFLRKGREIAKHLGEQGFGISYVPASPRHAKAYHNILNSLGFTKDTKRTSMAGKLGYHVWNPPKPKEDQAPQQLSKRGPRRFAEQNPAPQGDVPSQSVTEHLPELAKKFGGEMTGDYGDILHIPHGNRAIHINQTMASKPHWSYTSFGYDRHNMNHPDIGGYTHHEDEVQPGSMDLLRKVRDIWKHLGDKGYHVTYTATGKRARMYASMLKSLGFTLDEKNSTGQKYENKGGEYVWIPPSRSGPIKMAKHVETPEQAEAKEAKEKYDKGEISLYQYLKAQSPGFRLRVGDKEYINSFDRGPMVKDKFPVKAFQGSAIGQKELYSPKTLAFYQKFLEENPTEDTEAIIPIGNEKGYSIYDGHHRQKAYENAKREHIPVWRGLDENAPGGKPLQLARSSSHRVSIPLGPELHSYMVEQLNATY